MITQTFDWTSNSGFTASSNWKIRGDKLKNEKNGTCCGQMSLDEIFALFNVTLWEQLFQKCQQRWVDVNEKNWNIKKFQSLDLNDVVRNKPEQSLIEVISGSRNMADQEESNQQLTLSGLELVFFTSWRKKWINVPKKSQKKLRTPRLLRFFGISFQVP